MTRRSLVLSPDRCFSPDPAQRTVARSLYESVRGLPLVCPHGHVDPRLFVEGGGEGASWGTPADLLIIPDHYVFRMLYSQGIPLEDLGVPESPSYPNPAPKPDPRAVWQRFADHFYLFRGTPTGLWFSAELAEVFGIDVQLDGETAQEVYDLLASALAQPDFSARSMYDRFNIEVLCTTDAATDTLDSHRAILASEWGTHPKTGQPRIRPTFRPDKLVNLDAAGWREEVVRLGQLTGRAVTSFKGYIDAIEDRRAFFKQTGAKATDHAVLAPFTAELAPADAEAIFQRALKGQAAADDVQRFAGHMLMEMARMSVEDGLVMQVHAGSFRNHNPQVYERFGLDKGSDIPVAVEWTRNLRPLLAKFGNDPRLTLVLFCMDESTYGRELAPLAGHYPALRLGPPWRFFDSLNGMRRYFDEVMDTAGLYNTAGFNDDTRAYPSIPARHDVWRRASADWLASLLVRGVIDEAAAQEMIVDCAYGLAKRVYKL